MGITDSKNASGESKGHPKERVLWVNLSYCTYGLVFRGRRVIEAPPIAKWMTGKQDTEVITWLDKKGAQLVWLPLRHAGWDTFIG